MDRLGCLLCGKNVDLFFYEEDLSLDLESRLICTEHDRVKLEELGLELFANPFEYFPKVLSLVRGLQIVKTWVVTQPAFTMVLLLENDDLICIYPGPMDTGVLHIPSHFRANYKMEGLSELTIDSVNTMKGPHDVITPKPGLREFAKILELKPKIAFLGLSKECYSLLLKLDTGTLSKLFRKHILEISSIGWADGPWVELEDCRDSDDLALDWHWF